jgi:hypothetical protein
MMFCVVYKPSMGFENVMYPQGREAGDGELDFWVSTTKKKPYTLRKIKTCAS